MQLQNKTAIVTGAASGIGKEIARQFIDEGARVAIADLNLEAARAAAKELDPSGAATVAVRMDVTSEDEVENGVEEICQRFGGIDILVSNAGIQIVSPVDQFEFGDLKTMLAIHLDGAFLTTRAALRRMYAQGRGGSILYIGSVHSKEASRAWELLSRGDGRRALCSGGNESVKPSQEQAGSLQYPVSTHCGR
jgi:3-hydroxybutyrate dehydrogenase